MFWYYGDKVDCCCVCIVEFKVVYVYWLDFDVVDDDFVDLDCMEEIVV